jgi:ATP-dependent Clp protease ATP-binding subunit ClpC
MSAYRYPIVMWRDRSGAFSGAVVGDFDAVAASGATEDEVMRQLRELIEWRFENEPWNVDPDMNEAELTEIKVEIRPQYRTRKRIIPCPETVWLLVPCVTGLQGNGLRLCIVPHFNLQFTYREPAELKSLVGHYVKESMQTLSPAQLAGCLPPRGCTLKELVLRDSNRNTRRVPLADRREMKILFMVADPLLHDSSRKHAASAAYGREHLVQTLIQKLGREGANVLLVGEPGVGKSTVLFDAVRQLSKLPQFAAGNEQKGADESAARELRTYRYWRGSGGRMIAGMRYLGEWEERCEAFIARLSAIEGVFCAENLLELAQAGGQGPGDSVAAFLLPYLQRRELRMVAEATPAEVEACRRLLPGLLDVFQVVEVPSMDDTTAINVLNRVASAQASGLKLVIEPGVVALAHRLHKRFKPYLPAPGPAADFVRTLCDRSARKSTKREKTISALDVVHLFIEQTGLPEMFLRDDLLMQIEDVRSHFTSPIIGQPDATLAAARLVTTIKSGMTDPARPMGVLLFSGPTGVGKTALAKALVEYCFGAGGQKDRLVRLDMSEFGGWGATQRLLQGPHNQPAGWIQRVRRQPFCVVLFDEIEKAAPEVFDTLLGLLDEGRLTDRFGRVTWFRSAIIVMTSNLGANVPTSAGFSTDIGPSYESEVSKFFRPEFFNRLDAVITFKPLTREEVESITRKELGDMAAREGFAASGIRLDWTERLVAFLAREGYDQRFGARPLQRAIERLVVIAIARWKIANTDVRNAELLIDLDEKGGVRVTNQ